MLESTLLPFLESLGSDPQLSPLNSEHDENFLARFSNRNSIVVKLMGVQRYHSSIDLILECMKLSGHIHLVHPSPVILGDHFCVAYEYIATGCILSSLSVPLCSSLVFRIGAAVGELDNRLATSRHNEPRKHRLEWHFANFPSLTRTNLQYVSSARQVIEKISFIFSSVPFDKLPHQICHNDCNDDNIIVSNDSVVIIDYCDVDYVPRVCDIAILCTYLTGVFLRHSGDAERIVEQVMKPAIAGFRSCNNSLTSTEVSLIPLLTISRAAMSVLVQSKNMQVNPDNAAYLGCSMKSNLQLLNFVESIGVEKFINSL